MGKSKGEEREKKLTTERKKERKKERKRSKAEKKKRKRKEKKSLQHEVFPGGHPSKY